MPQPDRLNELPGLAGSICVACNIGTILPAQKINSNNVEGNKGQFFSKVCFVGAPFFRGVTDLRSALVVMQSSHPQNTSPQLPKQTVVLYGGLFQRGIIRRCAYIFQFKLYLFYVTFTAKGLSQLSSYLCLRWHWD